MPKPPDQNGFIVLARGTFGDESHIVMQTDLVDLTHIIEGDCTSEVSQIGLLGLDLPQLPGIWRACVREIYVDDTFGLGQYITKYKRLGDWELMWDPDFGGAGFAAISTGQTVSFTIPETLAEYTDTFNAAVREAASCIGAPAPKDPPMSADHFSDVAGRRIKLRVSVEYGLVRGS